MNRLPRFTSLIDRELFYWRTNGVFNEHQASQYGIDRGAPHGFNDTYFRFMFLSTFPRFEPTVLTMSRYRKVQGRALNPLEDFRPGLMLISAKVPMPESKLPLKRWDAIQFMSFCLIDPATQQVNVPKLLVVGLWKLDAARENDLGLWYTAVTPGSIAIRGDQIQVGRGDFESPLAVTDHLDLLDWALRINTLVSPPTQPWREP